jgi:hypothetical protein
MMTMMAAVGAPSNTLLPTSPEGGAPTRKAAQRQRKGRGGGGMGAKMGPQQQQ